MTNAQVMDSRLRGNDEEGDRPHPWRPALTRVAIAWALSLALFWRDAVDMAAIWWNSSTFNHCLLIIPILWWLVDQRKGELAKITPQSWLPPLAYVGAGAFGWLLGDAAGVALARQAGLVMMLQGSVAALLGPNATRGLLFPLFYMAFLVPAGEELVPPLQTLTAQMCMALLGWAGIPAHIEGIFISTPTALFRVAEACSGVKFLIAMVALGALVANLCFHSWPRRIAFMAACVAIPILANGLRAFGTIYIAHHGNVDFAASFDHVFYGWIFFGVVIALVMGAGWPFFDKSADAQPIDAAKLQGPVRMAIKPMQALVALFALAAAPVLWSSAIAVQPSPVPERIALPVVPGWQVVPYQPMRAWKPNFAQASHELLDRYRNAQGQEADLYVAVYDRQSDGRELIGFGQGAVGPESNWSWTENCRAPPKGKCERITANGPVVREVASFYRVDGVTSGSGVQVKLATLKARLLGGNQQAVAILVSAERKGKVQPRAAIDAFLADLGSVDKMADRMAGLD